MVDLRMPSVIFTSMTTLFDVEEPRKSVRSVRFVDAGSVDRLATTSHDTGRVRR